MLEEIIKDFVHQTEASNQILFSLGGEYKLQRDSIASLQDEWRKLTKDQQESFGNVKAFYSAKGALSFNDDLVASSKNYYLASKEAEERVNKESGLRLIGIDELNFDNSVLELAESIENIDTIRSLYKLRKKTVGASKNAGIPSNEANKIRNCFIQGRELYLAGRNGSLMVKPLNFFYALTAYAFGAVILNSPIRFNKGNLPGSHGMQYLPGDLQAQFGGDTARGTFSELITAFPTQLIKNRDLEINQNCLPSIMSFYKHKFTVNLGTLLSMVPEMAEYYKLTTGENSRAHPLDIKNANDARSLKWEFQIGNGEHKPSLADVARDFSGFEIKERYGKIMVTVPSQDAHGIKATIYTDIRGKFWYIENPFSPIILPEICLHFLILNVFASIMRYRPEEWGNVLTNDVASNIGLVTRHYFSSLQQKFFVLILRDVSSYAPYVASVGP